jgi:acetyl esterase/lipase
MRYEVETFYDLRFQGAGESVLALDLYLPASRPKECPTVVYLHGGGWARGSRADYVEERILPIVRSGVAVAAASYRFVEAAIWPAQLDDVARAVEFIGDIAAEHGLDARRISLWGASAGGQLACMAALRPPTKDRINGAVAWFAPTDLESLSGDPLPEDPILPHFLQGPWVAPTFHFDLVGGRGNGLERKLRDASPISYVTGNAPPFLLFHGDRDPVVPPAQTARFHQRLIGAGVESHYSLVVGATHEDSLFHHPSVLGAMIGYIKSLPPLPAAMPASERGVAREGQAHD